MATAGRRAAGTTLRLARTAPEQFVSSRTSRLRGGGAVGQGRWCRGTRRYRVAPSPSAAVSLFVIASRETGGAPHPSRPPPLLRSARLTASLSRQRDGGPTQPAVRVAVFCPALLSVPRGSIVWCLACGGGVVPSAAPRVRLALLPSWASSVAPVRVNLISLSVVSPLTDLSIIGVSRAYTHDTAESWGPATKIDTAHSHPRGAGVSLGAVAWYAHRERRERERPETRPQPLVSSLHPASSGYSPLAHKIVYDGPTTTIAVAPGARGAQSTATGLRGLSRVSRVTLQR